MSSHIDARIHAEGYVSISNEAGANKNISIPDFLRKINQLEQENGNQAQEVGEAYTYPSSIHSVQRTTDGFIVSLYFNEREANIRHSYGESYLITVPNVMIRLELRKVNGEERYSIVDARFYATDKNRISLPTVFPSEPRSQEHIWALPFPNMYSGGNMCYGGNSMPSVIYRDWTVLDSVYQTLIIDASCNNDLNVPSVNDGPSDGDDWLQVLADHHERGDGFPYTRLYNY